MALGVERPFSLPTTPEEATKAAGGRSSGRSGFQAVNFPAARLPAVRHRCRDSATAGSSSTLTHQAKCSSPPPGAKASLVAIA